ncbi:hypothetical protein FWJ25_12670 [Marinobacter salinexigens]|uniref:Solute-binding protein family 3/N-terminal domain-containing protein n=1 Tax=Marinobacter salinexigens TaxID=2919747 RepID=A0A5B0VFC4_9GAMM|nr:hypothetical protein [Marinobacter salinexigens]KAA1173327.1 hypothetical protein FWJ25_12670 [Marinobacter salinexigens]
MLSTALRIFIVVLLPLVAQAQSQERFRVGVGLGMEEVIGAADGGIFGALAPIYRCVFERAGIDAYYLAVPVKRGLQYLQSNKISALMPLARNDDRDRAGIFAGTLFEVDYAFVSFKPLDGMEQNRGLRYAIPRSFIGRRFIQDENASIQEVSEWDQLVALLSHARVDVAIVPDPMIDRLFGVHADRVYRKIAGTLPASLYLSRAMEESGVADRVRQSVAFCRVDDAARDILR